MVVIQVAIYPERAASIRAGLDPEATTVEIDLDAITQDERDLLADHNGQPVNVTRPTVEDLFAALRTAAAKEHEAVEEILDAHRAVLEARKVTTWQERLGTSGDFTYDVVEPDWRRARRSAAPGGPDWVAIMARHRDKIREVTEGEEAAAWVRELEAINKDARERALGEWHEAEQAKYREREEGIARLKEWATRNGSERVRLLIEENMATWYGVAEDEYFADHTPAGFTPLTDEDYVLSLPVPDVPDIHALREARRIAATDDALGEPQLVRIGRAGDTSETPGGPAVRLAITGPHGAQCVVWRPVTDDHPAETSDGRHAP
ncbi:hypothetical protein ASG90_19380 [Nocardioides sp. Soil797]|nr:hypothetical protein ASG90_19380 [Nocardioides sp. Soil797]